MADNNTRTVAIHLDRTPRAEQEVAVLTILHHLYHEAYYAGKYDRCKRYANTIDNLCTDYSEDGEPTPWHTPAKQPVVDFLAIDAAMRQLLMTTKALTEYPQLAEHLNHALAEYKQTVQYAYQLAAYKVVEEPTPEPVTEEVQEEA